MKEFVEYIIKSLVEHPEDVSVSESTGEKSIVLEITVKDSDIGLVVGRQGNTIMSILKLVNAVGRKHGKTVRVSLIE
jgi:predicted RNA-binding protein YlqC (UPF0109 family)